MSLEQLSFILGGILVSIGLLGGGLEIRELRIPAVNRTARVLSLIGGLGFVSLALFLTLRGQSGHDTAAHDSTGPQQVTFKEPVYQGVRLDACFTAATQCGEVPATAWCKTQGYTRAVAFPGENVGERGIHTRQIGSQQECAYPFCASFVSITCEA